jgi:O-Antigen ligase
MSNPRTQAAALLMAAVSVLFIWWGWKQGAYFGRVFYPGAMLVFALLALLAWMAPFDGRLRGPARVALLALLALAAWTLLSAVWSPRPAAAVAYAWHGFLYAALFAIGLWATCFLRGRPSLALAPVALAGAVLGVATTVVLATGTDLSWYLHDDATLRFPIGYRNANAAFWMICFWALLPLLLERKWRWQLRALLAGAGTVLVEMTFLSQSRGSVPGIVLAALAFLVLSRERLRATAMLALVALPALPALPTLLDIYQHGKLDPAAIPLLRDSAKAIAATAGLSVALAALALGAAEPRLGGHRRSFAWIGWALAIGAAIAAIAGASLFVVRHGGGPVGFVDQRIKEFDRIGYPKLHGQGIRYGANVGSNRHDFWRVAVDEGLAHPLRGGGGGSFQVAYLEHRLSEEAPEDPHSVEALLFSELGFPGLLLFAAFLVAAALAGLRSRRRSAQAALLVAGALAAGMQWLVQASIDWLWNYPGVTAPAIFLLGAAAAPALFGGDFGRARRGRALIVAALLALALPAVPLYLSGRYEQRAGDEANSNPGAAVADFGRAADLDPLLAQPLLAKAEVQVRLGEPGPALATLREGARREPSNYAIQLLIARRLVAEDPRAARRAIRRARALNPHDIEVEALWRRLTGRRRAGY